MENIITVDSLKKSYGKLQAVKGISFEVKKGQMFAFLGPNGAGKSTTIDTLCTLTKPDSGKITIDGKLLGKDDKGIRESIGVVFQDSLLDKLLTVEENLYNRARFYKSNKSNKSNIKETVYTAAKAADVLPFIKRPYGKLSGGQRRRADIARALINTPQILFLDEPTTGLDPKTKESVWQMIKKLQKENGMTIFLTTHYMEEAATADYITIINHGKISACGTPYSLKQEYSSNLLKLKAKDKPLLIEQLKKMNLKHKNKNGFMAIPIENTLDSLPLLEQLKPFIEGFEVIYGSMEDVFLNITEGGKKNV